MTVEFAVNAICIWPDNAPPSVEPDATVKVTLPLAVVEDAVVADVIPDGSPVTAAVAAIRDIPLYDEKGTLIVIALFVAPETVHGIISA